MLLQIPPLGATAEHTHNHNGFLLFCIPPVNWMRKAGKSFLRLFIVQRICILITSETKKRKEKQNRSSQIDCIWANVWFYVDRHISLIITVVALFSPYFCFHHLFFIYASWRYCNWKSIIFFSHTTNYSQQHNITAVITDCLLHGL